jgi:transposase
LAIAPAPTFGSGLSRSKIAAALRRRGRQRRVEERAAQIQTALRAEHLQPPPVIAEAMGASVAAFVAVTVELVAQIDQLEQELADHFDQHPDGKLIRSLPGLGMILGARALGEFGDDPNRFCDAKSRKNYASTSPITRASDKHRVVLARYARNRRLADVCYRWAIATLTASPAPERSTTSAAPEATPTTEHCAPSPTGSSASSTAASPTAPSTTNTSPGDTASNSPLDKFDPWDV